MQQRMQLTVHAETVWCRRWGFNCLPACWAVLCSCSAVVWRARCLTNNQIVAVKILNLECQMAPLEDIVHEAQTMKVRVACPGLHFEAAAVKAWTTVRIARN
jgi:hypothetical protein